MNEKRNLALLLAVAIIGILQLVLLLRKPTFETRADLNARMGLLEQGLQAANHAMARTEASGERIEQQLRLFIQTTSTGFESSRRTLDDKLEKTIEESRNGRVERLAAFRDFEGKLEQRIGTLENTIATRLSDNHKATGDSLESTRQAIDAKLAQTLEESRGGRTELTVAFQALESKLEQRIGGFDASMTGRFESLQQALQGRLDEAGKAQMAQFTQAQTDAAHARTELGNTLTAFRSDLTTTLTALAAETQTSREALAQSSATFEKHIQERFEALGGVTKGTLDSLKSDIGTQMGVMSTALKDQLQGNGNQIHKQFTSLQDTVAQQLQAMAQGSHNSSEQLRTALNERLAC